MLLYDKTILLREIELIAQKAMSAGISANIKIEIKDEVLEFKIMEGYNKNGEHTITAEREHYIKDYNVGGF